MTDNKDYTALTREELLKEEKKVKKTITTTSFITGVLMGIIVYGVAKNGFGLLYTVIPLALIYVNHKYAQTLKNDLAAIQESINTQNKSGSR